MSEGNGTVCNGKTAICQGWDKDGCLPSVQGIGRKKEMPKGLVVILSGASSVGKGDIRRELLKDPDLKLFYSISETTRPKREDEEDGKDYFFVTYREFAESVKKKELLEYTEFNGYYYGTPKAQVEFLTGKDKNVLIEVEAQGVGPIELNIPDSVAFFVMPESTEQLVKQIKERYRDDEASAARRISKAEMEMDLAPLFRHTVKNTNTEEAVAEIKKVIVQEMEKRSRNQ
jgi:guanylate kinase